jgi:hypothetical protein
MSKPATAPKVTIGGVFRLLIRYAVAVVVAFCVSVIVIVLGVSLRGGGLLLFLTNSDAHGGLAANFLIAAAASFGGVLAGSAVVWGRDRRLAAIALTLLGLIYYYGWWDSMKGQIELAGQPGFPLMLPLGLGGLCAFGLNCLVAWRLKRSSGATRFQARD